MVTKLSQKLPAFPKSYSVLCVCVIVSPGTYLIDETPENLFGQTYGVHMNVRAIHEDASPSL